MPPRHSGVTSVNRSTPLYPPGIRHDLFKPFCIDLDAQSRTLGYGHTALVIQLKRIGEIAFADQRPVPVAPIVYFVVLLHQEIGGTGVDLD